MTRISQANELAVLAGGANPEWSTQTLGAMTTYPSGSGDGVATDGAIVSYFSVTKWAAGILGRTARIDVLAFDSSSTFSLSIGGRPYFVSSGAPSVSDMMGGFVSQIGSDSSAVVTASLDGDTLVIVGNGVDPDYSITGTTSGGGASWAAVAEATEVEMYPMAYDGTVGTAGDTVWRTLGASVPVDTPSTTVSYRTGHAGRIGLYTELSGPVLDASWVSYTVAGRLGPSKLPPV